MTAFTLEFEDGSTGRIVIDEFTLNRGDYIVRLMASQKYPGRKIKEVSGRPHEQPT
jgi:hypothetical protein